MWNLKLKMGGVEKGIQFIRQVHILLIEVETLEIYKLIAEKRIFKS